MSNTSVGSKLESPVVPVRAQPGRRLIAAWVYDFLVYYWLSVIFVGLLNCFPGPDVFQRVPLLVVTMLMFLTRDYFFEGRGVGKNFLGLQVLDASTGNPASLKQSVIRNFLFVGPYLIYQLAVLILFFIPISHSDLALLTIKYLMQAWAILLLPIEGFLMHRGRGMRLADKLSGTVVVFQKPDFANPFSRPRPFRLT